MGSFAEVLKSAKGFVCLQPVTEAMIKNAEEQLGVHFADDYRDYAASFGAACIEGHELTGVCEVGRLNVIDVTLAAREFCKGIPDDLYVVEETHIDGILIWQNATGKVFSSAPGAELKPAADSLKEYLGL